MITDAHNHLHLLPGAKLDDFGVDRCATCGTCPADWQAVLDCANDDPAVTPAIGLHPWSIGGAPPGWLGTLRELLQTNPRAAIGEIGLDNTKRSPPIGEQVAVLHAQLDLACELDRAIALHCVRAYGNMLENLSGRGLPQRGLLLHAYRGAPEMIARFAALPCPVYFSISAPELLRHIPAERLLVESDASPDNARTPAHVVDLHAAHGIDTDRVASNYLALFPD